MKHQATIYDFVIYGILLFACTVTLIPIMHVVSVSFSGPIAVAKATIMLYPQEFSLNAYHYIFGNQALIRSLGITVFITVAGTLLNLIFTVSMAYPLSKRGLLGAKLLMLMVIFIMTFSAGIIPQFLNVKNFGLINSVWAMILPGLINTFYLVLMRSFMMELPEEIEESARMDGCNEVSVLLRIIVPLSLPAMATLGLFYAVGHWNEFFKGLFYINDSAKWPLQVLLKTIVFDNDMSDLYSADNLDLVVLPENVQSAAIVFSMAPIALLYPFLQKYFIRGLVLGAVKG